MKKSRFIITFAFALLLLSCKKNELGGKSTVSGKVAHHSKAIPYASVFIKFDASDFPGKDTTFYDAKVSADVTGNYSISTYKGKYYLYSFGFDYAIDPPYHVLGGVPVNVRNNEKVQTDIAVTEN